ncbi:hypothetical protein [Moraxella lacunata]
MSKGIRKTVMVRLSSPRTVFFNSEFCRKSIAELKCLLKYF